MSPYYSVFFSTGLPTQYFGPEPNKAPDLIFRFFSYPNLFATSLKYKFSSTVHLFHTLMFSSNIVLKNNGFSPDIKCIKSKFLQTAQSRMCQNAHSGIVNGRHGLGQTRTLARGQRKKRQIIRRLSALLFPGYRPGCYVFDFTLFLCSDSYHFRKSPNIFSSASARASAASSI